MNIQPSGAALGAVVAEIELAKLDDATFRRIEDAWRQYAVLVFPNQHLSNEEHLNFTRRFGRLEKGLKSPSTSGLINISNATPDGIVAAPDSLQNRINSGNCDWHSDSSYKRVGAKASILAAHQAPSEGGETEWADMRAAYEALDDQMKAWLEGKIAVHSYLFSHASLGGLELLNEEELARLPPVEHPLIRVHPETGRKCLFVGRHASHILGEDLAESRALLRKLTEDACRPPRIWKHKWRSGDIALWDNRCVLHRGHEWPLDQPRVMVRSTVAGDAADNEWAIEKSS